MKKFSFRSSVLFWLAVFAISILYVVFDFKTISSCALEEYHKLLVSQPHKERRLQRDKEKELTKQTRWDVEKKMWMTKGPERLLLQISGSRSDLGVYVRKSETHLIETFYNAKGILQQELYYVLQDGTELVLIDEGRYRKRTQNSHEEYKVPPHMFPEPKQLFKYFEAKRAVYDFHTYTLVLYDVTFWTFTAGGHNVVAEPKRLPSQSVGRAETMTLYPSTQDSAVNFCAEGLKMQLIGDNNLW